VNKPSTAMAVTASLLAAGCASSPPGEVKFATRFRDASTRRDAVRDLRWDQSGYGDVLDR
jgi:hypothetical protein